MHAWRLMRRGVSRHRDLANSRLTACQETSQYAGHGPPALRDAAVDMLVHTWLRQCSESRLPLRVLG